MPLGSKENVLEVIEVEPSSEEAFASLDPLIVAPVLIGKPRAVRMLFVALMLESLNPPGKQLPPPPLVFKLLASTIDGDVPPIPPVPPLVFVKHFCSLMCILM